MQLLTRLMLNGGGIVLQLVYMVVKTGILRLQLLHLLLQTAGLLALVSKYSETIVPEDHAVTHHQHERSCTQRRQLAARIVEPRARRRNGRSHAEPSRILLLFAQTTRSAVDSIQVSRIPHRKFADFDELEPDSPSAVLDMSRGRTLVF